MSLKDIDKINEELFDHICSYLPKEDSIKMLKYTSYNYTHEMHWQKWMDHFDEKFERQRVELKKIIDSLHEALLKYR